MGNGEKTILVTGATGRQGGAVIRHMLPNGWKLRALTRNPNGYAARQLSGQGVEIVQGDLEDPASLERAARGVYGIFSVQDYWVSGSNAKSGKAKTWRISRRRQALRISSTALSAERSATQASPRGKPSGKSKSIFGCYPCQRPFSGRLGLWKST